MINKLESAKNDNNLFWTIINKLNPNKHKLKEDIPITNFIKYYKELTTKQFPNNNQHVDILKNIKILECNTLTNTEHLQLLNHKITPTEIIQNISNLKNGKSAAADKICNEMLTYGINELINPLVKLFNIVLDSGHFPHQWNESLITLIHKKGNIYDPANYRGISVTNCIGKVFTKILNTRIYEFLKKQDLISENQIGFKKKCRTSDHIFILKTLIDLQKKKKKKNYLQHL